MRPRAAPKLASLQVPVLLEALGEGMRLVAEHVAALERDAEELRVQNAPRGVEAIRVVSEEEAGKFLILLDVVRAAFADSRVKSNQLRRASHHIAKGIYARAADIRPASYGELLRFVDHLRRSHYLDGPNDVDWIFRNEIEADREERLYVDFIEADDGDMWLSPERFDDLSRRSPPAAVELVASLARVGVCDPRALAIVAGVWRGFVPEPDTHWADNERLTRATLEQLPADLASVDLDAVDVSRILETWTFPLHGADLRQTSEDVAGLRERQLRWDPYGMAAGDY